MNRMWSVRHEARESLAHPGHGAFLKGCQKRITSSRLHHPTRSWLKLHVQAMSCFADFTRLSWVSQDFQKSLVGFTKLWFHKVWSNRMGHIYIYIHGMRQVQVSAHGVKERAASSIPCSSQSLAVCTLGVTWEKWCAQPFPFCPIDRNIHGFMFASLTGACWALRLGHCRRRCGCGP